MPQRSQSLAKVSCELEKAHLCLSQESALKLDMALYPPPPPPATKYERYSHFGPVNYCVQLREGASNVVTAVGSAKSVTVPIWG